MTANRKEMARNGDDDANVTPNAVPADFQAPGTARGLRRRAALRRSPMKPRTSSLSRRSPLRSSANGPTQRSSPKGTRHVIPTATRMVVARRSGGRCEAPEHAPECTGRADHMHHRMLLSQGGSDHPTNLLHTSWKCHQAIHANPARSYANGSLVRRWRVIEEAS